MLNRELTGDHGRTSAVAVFQEFEHGKIYWTPKDTLALTVKGQ